jgi:hypothetical protein
MSVQFDEDQSVALFAYLDRGNEGLVHWEDFADHVLVPNPRSALT